jgi:hypothetical protein
MNFKKIQSVIRRCAWGGLSLALSCSLQVTPPDNYPPPDDVVAPQPPAELSAVLMVNDHQRPAMRLGWRLSPDQDVLFYRIYRTSSQDVRELPAQLSPGTFFYDEGVVFPTWEGTLQDYSYAAKAIDSSGNFSNFSDSVSVTLSIPPVLLAPNGILPSNDPNALAFSWESQYTIGKEFYLYLLHESHDTLLAAHIPLSRYGFDQTSYTETFQMLKSWSNAMTPAILPKGAYCWWIKMVLIDLGTTSQRPASIAVGHFTVE